MLSAHESCRESRRSAAPRSPRLPLSVLLLFGILASLGPGTAGILAQEPPFPDDPIPADPMTEEEARSLHALDRPVDMTPASGPSGTRVKLEATLLPALTPMQVALGGSRFGFEQLTLALTDQNGTLSVTVEIPEWAAKDRTHRFILFNAYFTSVYAATPIFHVTDADGRMQREGEVTWTGPECVTLTSSDDEVYNLVGELEGLDMGERVVVEGWIADSPEVISRVEQICPDEGMILQVAEVLQREEEIDLRR